MPALRRRALRRRARPVSALLAPLLLAPVLALVPPPGEAGAQSLTDVTVVSHTWPLVPDGLETGDRFRLLFFSEGTRDAQPTDIAEYNTWVQGQAAAGHSAIRQYSDRFRAVGSTSAVSALTNTGLSGSNVPIYWLNGDRVAATGAKFFSTAKWEHQAAADYRNEHGSKTSGSTTAPRRAFTGMTAEGEIATDIPLGGGTSGSLTGRTRLSSDGDSANQSPWRVGAHGKSTDKWPMFAVSLVFEVGRPPNEPATVVPHSWPLVPDGLGPGDQFRLLFLTDQSRDSQASDINTYNSWVQAQAAGGNGHAAIRNYSRLFRAVGCTSTRSALQNTGMSGSTTPIYWLNGDRVADSAAAFFSSTMWQHQVTADYRWESGDGYPPGSAIGAMFGCHANGQRFVGYEIGENSSAGNATLVAGVRNQDTSTTSPFGDTASAPPVNRYRMFAVSLNFEVGQPPSEVTYVSEDWPHVPGSLGPGDRFRLMFLTSQTIDGRSTDITAYNAHAQHAARGHRAPASLRAYAGGFSALVSTVETGARANAAMGGAGDGIEVWWLNGKKIADSYSDFYDGTWANNTSAELREETGNRYDFSTRSPSGAWIYSGTTAAGEPSSVNWGELGTDTPGVIKWDDGDIARALAPSGHVQAHVSLPVHAISGVFQVARAAVPDADGAYTVPADWPLRPTGVGAGEKFRLLFVTSDARDGIDAGIASYNAFVQQAAGRGHPALRHYTEGFAALASTAAVDARDNTATTGTGVPIYWVNGGKAADDYADFYDGTWDARAWRDEDGSYNGAMTNDRIWTGSSDDGTEDTTNSGLATGPRSASAWVSGGRLQSPLNVESRPHAEAHHFYGVSPVFRVAAAASATQTVPADWPLLPSGVGPGEQFRLLFITTGKRDATSADIGDYNAFVRAAAAAGHPAWGALAEGMTATPAEGMTALVSTAAVDARDNTATTGTGVPIYWADGAKVADDYADFYDGSWDAAGAGQRRSEHAEAVSGTFNLWTGSRENGTEDGSVHGGLGAGTESAVARSGSNDRPLQRIATWANTRSARFYGLSEVLEVADWTMSTKSTLLPSGLSDGDKFRLLFITRTERNGESSNIGDYNKFVQDAAKTNAGLAAIADGFRAVGSTYAVSARDNTGTRGTGVPIYWVNGIKIVDNYNAFYGFWSSSSGRFADGGVVTDASDEWFLTGTSTDGSRSERYLGRPDGTEFTVGNYNFRSGLQVTSTALRSAEYGMMGLSPVLTAVEPTGPAATVTADTSPVTEGTRAAFTVTLAEPSPTSFSLTYELTQQGDVYGGGSLGTKSLPIAANDTTVSLSVPTAADLVDEPDGSLTVTIVEGDGYTVGDPASATVEVTDDDATSVSLSVPDRLLVEGETSDTGLLRLRLSRALASGESLGVPLGFSGGAVGTDFSLALVGSPSGVALSGSTVTFTGPSAASAAVTLTAVNDVDASNERVSASIPATSASGSPKLTETGLGVVTGAVEDDPWLLIDDDDETVTDPATQQVPSDWSLIPTGLSTGDRFRLLFISSTKRKPTSADIADYNGFVQARAAAGHTDIQSYSAGFRAVASSPFVDASANTATASTDTDAQIWWLGGPKAADDYADFWDGTWDNEADGASGDWRTEAGSVPTLSVYDLPATGTASGGAKHATAFLGTVWPTSGSLKVIMGNPGRSGGPVDGGTTNALTPWSYRMYGLSQVYEVVPVVQFASAAYSAGEASGSRSRDVVVNLSAAAPAGGLTLSYSVGGTATAGSDYTALTGTVTVAANASSATIAVTVLDDAVDDDDETVVLTLTDGTGYSIGARNATTLTISDDDDPPAVDVAFSVESSAVLEGGTARFSAHLQDGAVAPTGGLVLPITVNKAPAQSSDASPADYGTVPTSIVIAPGESRGAAALSVTDDALDELRERIRFAPGALPAGYQLDGGTFDASAQGRVTIRDRDATVVSLSGGGNVTEGDTTTSATVTVSLSRALRNDPLNTGAESISAPLTLTESTGAARGSQYTMSCPSPLPTGVTCSGLTSGTPTVTFTGSASSASSVAVTFTGGPTADSDTASGSVSVSLGTLSASRMDGGAAKHGTATSASVVVTDASAADLPVVSVAAGSAVTEGSAAGFTVSVSPAPTGTDTVTVHYSVGHTGGDYVTAANRGAKSVVVGSGGSATVSVATQADSVDEPDGTVTVAVSADTAYNVSGSAGSASVSVSDDDATSVALAVPDRFLSEGSSSATATLRLTVSRALVSGESLGVPLAFSGGTLGSDFSLALSGSPSGVALSGSTVTFTGPSAASADVTVAEIDDTDASNERVSVSIPATSASGNPRLAATGLGTVTGAQPGNPWLLIDDDDESAAAPAEATVAADWALVPSGLSAGDRFRLLFISSTKRDATSADIADYNSFVQARAAAGHTDVQSYSGGFRAVASSPFVDATANTATASTDTDAPIYWLGGPKAADDYADFWDGNWDHESSPLRDEAGSQVTFLAANRPWTGTASGGAKASAQHLGTVTPTGGALVANAGNPGGSPGGPVDGGTAQRASLSTQLTLYGLSQVFVVATPSATPEAQFSSSAYSAGEASGSRSADVTVSLSSAAPAGGLTLSYSVGGTATAGSDYTALSGTVTVAANASSATVTVTVLDDSTVEGDETVELTLTAGSGYTVSATAGSATVTISDDDSTGTLPVLSLEPGSVTTEGSSAYFSVIAKPSVSGTLSVSYTVTQDGAFVASGDLGSQSADMTGGFLGLTVPTQGDSTDETSGSVTVALNAGNGYTVDADAASSTVLVLDDDGATEVTVKADVAEVDEGGDAMVFVYVRPKPPAPVDIPLTLTLGTAEASDVGSAGSASFAKGDTTQRVTISTSADTDSDDDTFTVGIGSPLPAGYTVGAHSTAGFTIVDTGTTVSADPVLSIAAGAAVTEGTAASFTVTASPAPSGSLTVSYSVSQTGGYVSGDDTGSKSVSLDLSSGTATITVPTEADSADEPNGTVTVALSSGTGYTVSGTAGSATVDVADDDGPALPVVSVSSGAAVTEGTAARFTLTAAPAPTGPLTVSYTVTQSGDYLADAQLGLKSATVPTSGSVSVSVPTVGDSSDESDGSVTVTVNAAVPYTVHSSDGAATVNVADDDPGSADGPLLSLSRGTSPVTEGTAVTFTVTASPAPSGSLTVRYHVSQTGDWLSGTSGTTSAVLDLSGGTATISIATEDDTADETDGKVTVTVFTGSGYRVGSPNSLSVAVRDNDAGSTTTVDPGGNGNGGGGGGGGVSPGSAPAPAPAADDSERSEAVVVLADGWSPPDVGAAAALAARTPRAVVLYTDTHRLSAPTREFLADVLPARIVVIGGAAAVAEATVRVARRAAGLGAGGVERVAGGGRAETAAAAARAALGSPAAVGGPVTLVIANGWSPPDIGAAAALAARTPRSAVLYVAADALPEPTAAVIADYRPARIVIVGGVAAVTPAVAEAVRDTVPAAAVDRIAGADRADTAAQTARRALGDPARAYNATVVIANGWSPPDIGAAAALAARTPRSAVLYAAAGRLPAAAQAVLADYRPANVIVIGGTSAVTPAVAEAIGDHAPDARLRRITGADRTETAANTAQRALAEP